MADDSGRDSLFGGAAKRNAGRPNKYAEAGAQPGAQPASAAAPQPAQAKPPAAKDNAPGKNANSDDDPNRGLLLAGGKKKPEPAAAAAVVEDLQPQVMQAADMFEGDLDFHFEDLNLTGGAAAGGPLDSLGGEGSLDFQAIDDDMQKFAQDEVVREALSRGVDLRQYSKQVEGELHSLELRSIADYVAESDNIAALFEQICGCESVLSTMQSLLQGFQDNLGGISDEIRSLQEESLGLSVKMQNRKILNGKIKAFLARVAVSEGLIARVCEGELANTPAGEAWLRDLRALAEKIEFISGAYKQGSALPTRAEGLPLPALPADELGAGAYSDSLSELSCNPFDTPAGRDAVPQVQKLQQKAVQRVREFLLRQIGEVVRPQLKMNMQKQQEYVLLKFAYAQAFLTAHGPDAAREVRGVYSDGVSRVYGEVFKTYTTELGRLALPSASKNDTIGNFHPGQQGAYAASANAPAGTPRPPNPFNSSERHSLLLEADAPALPLHVAQAERTRMPFEAAFRSIQRHLVDVAGSEAAFCHRFFGAREGREVYAVAMGKAISACQEMVEHAVGPHAPAGGSWDCAGLLLILAITTSHRKSLQERMAAAVTSSSRSRSSVHAATQPAAGPLDAYFDKVAMLVWPRFKAAFEAQVASVKSATRQRIGAPDAGAPHAVTRRFSELASSLLVTHEKMAESAVGLGGGLVVDESLPTQISGLTKEMEALWGRLGAELGGSGSAGAPPAPGTGAGALQAAGTGAKSMPRAAFMLHQYASLLNAYIERCAKAESGPFQQAERGVAVSTSDFCDCALDAQFSVLLAFVRKVETAAAQIAKGKRLPVPAIAGALSSAGPSGAPAAGSGPEGGIPSFLPDSAQGLAAVPADQAEAEAIVRDFALNWRSGLSGLNENVTRYFGRDVKQAMGVLKAVFSRFVELHARLSDIVARAYPAAGPAAHPGGQPAWVKEVVPLQTIYFEMRSCGIIVDKLTSIRLHTTGARMVAATGMALHANGRS